MSEPRFRAWLVTGPIGRVIGFALELCVVLASALASRLRKRRAGADL